MIAKAALLEAIAGRNRGLLSSESSKEDILVKIVELEAQNPTPRPVEALNQLNGDWRLLYTTSDELLRIDQFPLFKLGQIYQSIRAKDAKLYNIAELIGVPLSEGFFSVVAGFEPVSERRVQVKFERTLIGFQRLIGYRSPAEFIHQIEADQKFAAIDFKITNRDRQGWLDITYLDSDLRIGRGNVGSVFVLSRV